MEIIQMNQSRNNGGHEAVEQHSQSSEKDLSTQNSISSKTILHK